MRANIPFFTFPFEEKNILCGMEACWKSKHGVRDSFLLLHTVTVCMSMCVCVSEAPITKESCLYQVVFRMGQGQDKKQEFEQEGTRLSTVRVSAAGVCPDSGWRL